MSESQSRAPRPVPGTIEYGTEMSAKDAGEKVRQNTIAESAARRAVEKSVWKDSKEWNNSSTPEQSNRDKEPVRGEEKLNEQPDGVKLTTDYDRKMADLRSQWKAIMQEAWQLEGELKDLNRQAEVLAQDWKRQSAETKASLGKMAELVGENNPALKEALWAVPAGLTRDDAERIVDSTVKRLAPDIARKIVDPTKKSEDRSPDEKNRAESYERVLLHSSGTLEQKIAELKKNEETSDKQQMNVSPAPTSVQKPADSTPDVLAEPPAAKTPDATEPEAQAPAQNAGKNSVVNVPKEKYEQKGDYQVLKSTVGDGQMVAVKGNMIKLSTKAGGYDSSNNVVLSLDENSMIDSAWDNSVDRKPVDQQTLKRLIQEFERQWITWITISPKMYEGKKS